MYRRSTADPLSHRKARKKSFTDRSNTGFWKSCTHVTVRWAAGSATAAAPHQTS